MTGLSTKKVALRVLTALIMATFAFSQGCSTPSHSVVPSPVLSSSPAKTAELILTPDAAKNSPAPVITPSTVPTPTPHPWADNFLQQGVYIYRKSPDDGPWVYKDQTLSVNIEKRKTANKQVYYVAEIYTLGPLPFGGFANKNPKAGARILPYRIARQYQAVLGITGDYITYKANDKGVMIRNGKTFYDRKQADTLAVMPDGEFKVYSKGEITAKELLAAGVKDSFAFGPILVRGGKINKKLNKALNHYKNFRSTIGMVEKGHYVFIVTEGRLFYEELAQIYVDMGCTVAYNLDGGNSAAMVFMGEQLNLHTQDPDLKLGQRPLPDLLLIGKSPEIPGEKEPVYNNGERKSKKYRPILTSGS